MNLTSSLRISPLILLIAAPLLLLGCGGSESGTPAPESAAAPPAGERVLRVSQGSDVLTMDPYREFESPTICVLMNIFETLTDLDRELKLVPALAESWENLDPHHWEFRLHRNVRFHNGNEFDAQDVLYSLRRAQTWERSRVRSEIPTFKDAEIIDPHTIRIATSVPDAILPTRLVSIMIMDRESSEEGIRKGGDPWLTSNPVGTGPYRLGEWRKDSWCELVAFDGYRGGRPAVDRVRFLAMSNDATRVTAFLNGEIDILSHVPVQDIERVAAKDGYEVIRRPSLRLIYLGMDCGRDKSPRVPDSPPNPLKDQRVRQAIMHAIDIDLIVDKIMHGHARAADQLFTEEIIGHVPGLTRPPHDIEEAKRLMAKAGYANGFRVQLDSPNDRYVNDAKIAAAVASQLARINIEVTVNAIPKSRFFPEEQTGKSSFFLLGWTNGNGDGIGTFDHLLHTPDDEKNLGHSNLSSLYSNPALDRLIEASASEFDHDRRVEMIRAMTRIAMQDLPHIPLHFQMDIYAVSDSLDWTPRSDTQIRALSARWK